jgi:hypothetical protein
VSGFKKYLHVERFGNDEVAGIEDGTVHVFPKLDGTNASLWWNGERLAAGSRNRELSLGSDNAGFFAWACEQPALINFLREHPHLRLFGEWLVPHTLKAYREEAWRQFYVFDVAVDNPEAERGYDMLSYDTYAPTLARAGIRYIPPMKVITNGTEQDFRFQMEQNLYMLPDGADPGEGVVLKRYDFRNKYGKVEYAKLVRQQFREENMQVMGASHVTKAPGVELVIADEVVTAELVAKERAKIELQHETGWRSQYIPQLLGTVHHCVVTEELWSQLKKHKQPVINFKTLQRAVIERIRGVAPELF